MDNVLENKDRYNFAIFGFFECPVSFERAYRLPVELYLRINTTAEQLLGRTISRANSFKDSKQSFVYFQLKLNPLPKKIDLYFKIEHHCLGTEKTSIIPFLPEKEVIVSDYSNWPTFGIESDLSQY